MKLTLKKIIAVFMSAVILSGMNLVSFAESENSWKNKIDEEIYEKITDSLKEERKKFDKILKSVLI